MTSEPAAAAAPPNFALRMSVFFAGFFMINGVAMPWFPVWLEWRGFSEVDIASIIAIPMAFRVLMTPVGGVIADRMPTRRFAVRMFMVPAALVFLLAWPASTYWPILLFTGAAFTLWQLALPAGEALALTGVRRFGVDYGRVRLWGSVAFITANLGSGALLGILPTSAIFWFIFTGFVIAAAVSLTLPKTPRAVRALDDATRPEHRPAWKVLGHPAVLAPILAGGLIQGSHAVFYAFGSIYWQSLGFTPIEIGGFWAVSIVCEILLFAWSTAMVRRIGPFAMIALGGVAAIVRWGVFPEVGGAGYVLLQSLHALTFAAVFVGNQFAVVRAVPEEMAGSVQGVVVMVAGLIMAGLTAVAGPLYETYGGEAFRVMLALPLLGLIILLLHHMFWRRTEES